MANPTWRAWAALAAFVAVSFLPAAAGWLWGGARPGEWYQALAKPSFTPPGWVFGPVWTILYASMGVAAWMVWRKAGLAGGAIALTLFAVQLVFNGAWSVLFFGLHNVAAAFVDIVLLWLAIAATLVAFWRISTPAGALMLPYLAWVSFAAVLNGVLWRMNA
ncbi:MAG TPA: TspO/MBR family protein [Phycisphaerae bacterium]|nr:TspO/MBR family protein [Phycisphaerae bacterium]HUT61738.1 TspO/MBR family protein [Phycisphaerae bacterium]